jgi:hypothetical protein
MNDSSSTSWKRRRAWYCYHLLAAPSVLLLFVMLGAMTGGWFKRPTSLPAGVAEWTVEWERVGGSSPPTAL